MCDVPVLIPSSVLPTPSRQCLPGAGGGAVHTDSTTVLRRSSRTGGTMEDSETSVVQSSSSAENGGAPHLTTLSGYDVDTATMEEDSPPVASSTSSDAMDTTTDVPTPSRSQLPLARSKKHTSLRTHTAVMVRKVDKDGKSISESDSEDEPPKPLTEEELTKLKAYRELQLKELTKAQKSSITKVQAELEKLVPGFRYLSGKLQFKCYELFKLQSESKDKSAAVTWREGEWYQFRKLAADDAAKQGDSRFKLIIPVTEKEIKLHKNLEALFKTEEFTHASIPPRDTRSKKKILKLAKKSAKAIERHREKGTGEERKLHKSERKYITEMSQKSSLPKGDLLKEYEENLAELVRRRGVDSIDLRLYMQKVENKATKKNVEGVDLYLTDSDGENIEAEEARSPDEEPDEDDEGFVVDDIVDDGSAAFTLAAAATGSGSSTGRQLGTTFDRDYIFSQLPKADDEVAAEKAAAASSSKKKAAVVVSTPKAASSAAAVSGTAKGAPKPGKSVSVKKKVVTAVRSSSKKKKSKKKDKKKGGTKRKRKSRAVSSPSSSSSSSSFQIRMIQILLVPAVRVRVRVNPMILQPVVVKPRNPTPVRSVVEKSVRR